ncbi:hypothetical protein CYY_004298 [Polysphondylium violaceum]|uniref:Uncharacterized protein n=1 Tax=Polysphondylium violaceum TaxID=133409 RepID=A0A8J4V5D7_9MYCE|nr:hypothetical protein CYY_004298 [Polysphondylium violaceum]
MDGHGLHKQIGSLKNLDSLERKKLIVDFNRLLQDQDFVTYKDLLLSSLKLCVQDDELIVNMLSWRLIAKLFRINRTGDTFTALLTTIKESYPRYVKKCVDKIKEKIDNYKTTSIEEHKKQMLLLKQHEIVLKSIVIDASLEFLNTSNFSSFVLLAIELTTVEKTLIKPLADQIASMATSDTEQPKKDYLETSRDLLKLFGEPYQLLKNPSTFTFLQQNENSIPLVVKCLFDAYEYGVENKNTYYLNTNTIFKLIIQKYFTKVSEKININQTLEKTMSALLIQFKEYSNIFKDEHISKFGEIDPSSHSRYLKLFAYYSKITQFFFKTFGFKFDANILKKSITLIITLLSDLKPSKSFRINPKKADILNAECLPLIKDLFYDLLDSSKQDKWIKDVLVTILKIDTNSSSSNNSNNSLSIGQLKLLHLFFEKIDTYIDVVDLDFIVNHLLKSYFELSSQDCLFELYKVDGFMQFIVNGLIPLLSNERLCITSSKSFYQTLLSIMYTGTKPLVSMIISIWTLIFSNSDESLKNWILILILKNITLFNNHYELPNILSNFSILLTSIWKYLSVDQQTIIYQSLVSQTDLEQGKFPRSVILFLDVLDSIKEQQSLSITCNNLVNNQLVPFLMARLNQSDILLTPNLFENLLYLLSKIQIQSTEMVQSLIGICIEFLNCISDKELMLDNVFLNNGLCIYYAFEIVSRYSESLSHQNIISMLKISNQLSSNPIIKYSICNLLSTLNKNHSLQLIDHMVVMNYLQFIFINLFNTPDIILYEKSTDLLCNLKKSTINLKISDLIPQDKKLKIESLLNLSNVNSKLSDDDISFIQQKKFILDQYQYQQQQSNQEYKLYELPSLVLPIPFNSNTSSHNNNNQQQQPQDINNHNTGIPINSVLNGYQNSNSKYKSSIKKDDLHEGLDLIIQGIHVIKSQIENGIKLDKENLEKFRSEYKSVTDSLINMSDYLFK